MDRYPSIGMALDALQARNEQLERLVEERTAALDAARRDAEVEAALDEVRIQAMAVQHTDETIDVAVAVFETLRALGVPVLQLGLSGQPDPETHSAAVWSAGIDASGAARAGHFVATLSGHPVLDSVRAAAGGGARFVRELDPASYRAYLRALVAGYPASYADRVVARAPQASAYHYAYVPAPHHAAGARPGYLYAVLSVAPTEAALDTLTRFSSVFALAYARYLDLQQAETRARTSRVRAALERVRSHTLAMRESADLDRVVETLFAELRRLGVQALRTGAALVDGPTRQAQVWTTTARDPTLGFSDVRFAGHPLLDALYDAWRHQKSLSYILEGADRSAYYRLRDDLPSEPAPGDREYVHVVTCPEGLLYAVARAPFAEDTVQVMQQLVGVFSVATTRHRDLQLAETQAREAAQQASADRIRAEIASMRTVGDLDRITPRLWQELTALGVPVFRCAVLIVDEGAHSVRMHLATPDGTAQQDVDLPSDVDPLLARVVDHWRRQEALRDVLEPESLARWTAFLEMHGVEADTFQPSGEAPLALYVAPFVQGMLLVASEAPLRRTDGAAVHALADAFEVAYARYDDFRRLEAQKQQLEDALAELRAAQQQLVESEKLASLGALTAGIAHEIKNPLNFVVNFAVLTRELADEIADGLAGDAPADALQDAIDDLRSNAEKIEGHGRRADSIVRGMMQHARGGEGARELVDVNTLVEEYANLAYHGKRAQMPSFHAVLDRSYSPDTGQARLVPQDIGRVVINLLTNAFDAVLARSAEADASFTPTVRVETAATDEAVAIRIIDNGTGIPDALRTRVFEPFFTTKPPGSGTGLGLSMSHEIVVHRHGGRLTVESLDGEGTTFTITLPR